MNELHSENGFKVHITLQDSKKIFWFCLEQGLYVVGSYWKINYAIYFQLIHVLCT